MTRDIQSGIAGKHRPERTLTVLLLIFDFAGTLLFGMEGGLSAIAAHLDVFGALVLSYCTSLGGGILRDVLLGAVPPPSIRDWRYGTLAFVGGGIALLLHASVHDVPLGLLTTLDAAGLSLFAIAGTMKALSYEFHPLPAVLLGTITGVGGGTIRDVLTAQVPLVLRADVYATAALLGSLLFVVAVRSKMPVRAAAVVGGVACFVLRMVAASQHWNLPSSTFR